MLYFATQSFNEDEEDNLEIINLVGMCYQHGFGIVKDLIKATTLFKIAANKGYASAQHNLAYCYENDHGVEMSTIIAIEWYRKAAAQNHISSKLHLDLCINNQQNNK